MSVVLKNIVICHKLIDRYIYFSKYDVEPEIFYYLMKFDMQLTISLLKQCFVCLNMGNKK